MDHSYGGVLFIGLIYLAIVVGVVALVITALWRMVRAQESIAAGLVEIAAAIRESGGRPPL